MSTTEKPGKAIREKVPRSLQGQYTVPPDRPSVLAAIRASNEDRVKKLIPVRHARMSASPFTFYRGTASIMARDLSFQPHTSLKVQAIGDCHLMNFGGFATPERAIIFDANDFDETLPAPWEWDLKRLATSFVLAARHNGLREADARDMALQAVASYREGIYAFSQMTTLDLWYMRFELHNLIENTIEEKIRPVLEDAITRSARATPQKVLYRISRQSGDGYRLTDQPPLIYHPINVAKEKAALQSFLDGYRRSLQEDRRFLFSKYELVDIAIKVAGVGSVGTRCMVALLMNERKEPLLLQIKEARRSVLEPFTAKSKYRHPGERVVQGQRLVQAASDIFLGWSFGLDGRDYYLRQLKDHKISPDVESFNKAELQAYAGICGRMLARAHAKTGPRAVISGYIGGSDALDDAIAKFAVAYANQTEKDYNDFIKAIKAGKLPVEKT